MEHTSINDSENTIQILKSKNNTMRDYIESLDSLQYKALSIAIRELESSFSLKKSVGYIDYINSINQVQKP